MGYPFAEHLAAFASSRGIETGTISKIAKNPDQSKHLETATFKVFGLDLDLVNLRSEQYAEDSRIPIDVVCQHFASARTCLGPPLIVFLLSHFYYYLPNLVHRPSVHHYKMRSDAISPLMPSSTTSTHAQSRTLLKRHDVVILESLITIS